MGVFYEGVSFILRIFESCLFLVVVVNRQEVEIVS